MFSTYCSNVVCNTARLRSLSQCSKRATLVHRVRSVGLKCEAKVTAARPAPISKSSSSKLLPPKLNLANAFNIQIEKALTALHSDPKVVNTCLASAAGFGVLLGFLAPCDPFLPEPLSQLSSCMGWLYFLSWSISFYPQLLENWKRKSVEGFSADYIVYHAAGYVAYFLYTYMLLYNNDIRGAYALENAGSFPEVQLSDVLFAAHGFFIMIVTFWQYCMYSKDGKTMSDTCKAFVVGLSVVSAGYWHQLHDGSLSDPMAFLHFLYFLGNVKLVLTFLSYLPQAIMNMQRKSTEGFSIGQVMLDISGGGLSMMQVLLHGVAGGNWSEVTASPAKFLLGWCSMSFDILFLTQHYVLYPDKSKDSKEQSLQLQPARSAVMNKATRS